MSLKGLEVPRQKWTAIDAIFQNYGVVASGDLAGVDLALGLFRSQLDVPEGFADLLFDTDRARLCLAFAPRSPRTWTRR